MGVYGLIFRKGVPTRVRLQAMANVFCTIYMTVMTLGVTHISFFYIVPECYHGDKYFIFKCRMLIWYIFTSVIGNYVTCVFTDSGAKRQIMDSSIDRKDEIDLKLNNGPHETKPNGELRQRSNANGSRTVKEKDDGLVKNTRYCLICKLFVPARTHHCLLCEKCITKRDHHCFFMGVCIGRENHIYFVLFVLFMGLGTFYGMMLIAKYMYYLYGFQFEGPQTFFILFFNTMLRLLSGDIPSIRYLGLFVFLYVSLAGTMVSFGFFGWQMMIIVNGQTTYEATRGIHRFSKGGYWRNFRSVFDAKAIISLLVPFWDLVTETNYCRITLGNRRVTTKNTPQKVRKSRVKPK